MLFACLHLCVCVCVFFLKSTFAVLGHCFSRLQSGRMIFQDLAAMSRSKCSQLVWSTLVDSTQPKVNWLVVCVYQTSLITVCFFWKYIICMRDLSTFSQQKSLRTASRDWILSVDGQDSFYDIDNCKTSGISNRPSDIDRSVLAPRVQGKPQPNRCSQNCMCPFRSSICRKNGIPVKTLAFRCF